MEIIITRSQCGGFVLINEIIIVHLFKHVFTTFKSRFSFSFSENIVMMKNVPFVDLKE